MISKLGRFKKDKQLFRRFSKELFKTNPPKKIDIGAFFSKCSISFGEMKNNHKKFILRLLPVI